MKFKKQVVPWKDLRSLPAWGVWIEIWPASTFAHRDGESLPAWGVWIEIMLRKNKVVRLASLPAWGVWIEIVLVIAGIVVDPSLPAWGVWIEITTQKGRRPTVRPSLPAWGVWIEISPVYITCPIYYVTPRMGSVD